MKIDSRPQTEHADHTPPRTTLSRSSFAAGVIDVFTFKPLRKAVMRRCKSWEVLLDKRFAELEVERDRWKENSQSNAAAMNNVEEAFGQILPVSVRHGAERGPDPVEWAKDMIAAMHEVNDFLLKKLELADLLIDEQAKRIEELESLVERKGHK